MKFEDLTADLVNHPITGWLHTGEHLNVPLISHIVGGLYVGGCVHGVHLENVFTHIFSMYPWEKYRADSGTHHVEVTMYDSHEVDVEAVERYSQEVVRAIAEGGNVLVHCQAGINRSNLIAGAALMRMGRTADEAIALLRERRSPLVLANTTFLDFLRNWSVPVDTTPSN